MLVGRWHASAFFRRAAKRLTSRLSAARPHGPQTYWRQPRKALWRHSTRLAIAAALAFILALNLGGSGIAPTPAAVRDRLQAAAHKAQAKPSQRWGTAAGGASVTGKNGNHTIPASERGRYPLFKGQAAPKAPANKASVTTGPAGRKAGFDRRTSRVQAPRNATERIYDNADGTQTTEFSGTPINYRRPDGSWAPIDSDLAADGAGWKNTADAVDVRLAPRADHPELVKLTLDAGHVFAYGLAGAAAATGRADGESISYPGVLPDVDLKLRAEPGGSKETIVLRSAGAPRVYDFPLRLTGLTARLAGRQIELVDAAGQVRAVVPAGSMEDSADQPARSDNVSYALRDGGRTLRITADAKWLAAPERVFPVLLDPTVGPPVEPGAGNGAMYVRGSSTVGGGTELLVGNDGQNAASYIKFDAVSTKLANHTILGAGLSLINFDAGSCRSRPIAVHGVTQSWSADGNYSYPGPNVGGSLGSASFAHGYIPFGASSSPCPAAAEFIDLGDGGRKLIQGWANGGANNGLSLRANTSDSKNWKKFGGTSTANKPTLYVTHSPYNAKYEIPNPVPVPDVTQVQDGKVKVTVTNTSAEGWTPSTYYLAYRAYNAQTGAAVGQQRAATLPGNVARNGKVTLDATVKHLPPGTYFLDFTMVRTGGAVFTDYQVPPARIVLRIIDIPAVIAELYPPNGYQAQTLQPLLWARAVDTDAPPGQTLQFKFEVCDVDADGKPVSCTNSGYQTKQAWTVPAGRLVWGKSYQWRTTVKDNNNETVAPYSTMFSSVPQPDVISKVAGAPYAEKGREFDANTGNLSTAAVDAVVATAGVDLNVARTYNSTDPRTDGAFGAGWSSRYDMKVVPDTDGSGNVVITYQDGQAVRFGKNPDGTFVPPSGRVAKLTTNSTSWVLLDKSGTTYTFSLGSGKLSKITNNSGSSIVFTNDTNTGKLAKAQVSNSQTNTAGRALKFTWTGNHVTQVTTDVINGAALVWKYTYDGDQLKTVCTPDSKCTTYDYSPGSHYRTAVQDAKPESYWRLNDSASSTGAVSNVGAASDVAVNLGKDAGTYQNVTLGADGALAGTDNKAASFNGTNSSITLPKGTLKKSRDAAVEVWFKIGLTQTGGPLIGYQDKALGTTPTNGVPILYTGTDGLLRGQFAVGAIDPITSSATVNNNVWHHAVLTLLGGTQTLWLDGNKVGERTNVSVDANLLSENQIGAATVTTPASWKNWGTANQRSFQGVIDEVAIYNHPLGEATVKAHKAMSSPAAQQLSRVTLPSNKIASQIVYDTDTDRVKEYTDGNGGTWDVGKPAVYGDDDDLRRSIQVNDPADRPYLYEYDAITGQMLRSGTPLGLETRPEDLPRPSTPPSDPPVEQCSQPDPQDPGFCTIIPDDSGGPIFVRHDLDGMAIRSFSYNAQGFQNKVTNENGDSVEMTYDKRGNVVTRKTCRTQSLCFTSYTTYSTTITDEFDPRRDLAVETRDSRSASATDANYDTSYTYAPVTGNLLQQNNPDGSYAKHTYTNGGEPAVGGGNPPSGLLATTTDARDKTTQYAYYQNGDLARVTDPMGLITEYTYDTLGRKVSEKQTSDTFPNGVTTAYSYDAQGRMLTGVGPATTDAVTGVKHQTQTANVYDADGNVTSTTVSDLLGGDQPRTALTEFDEYNRPIRQVDPLGNETTAAYDRFGNKVSEQDANGNRVDYAYTAQNKIAEVRLRDWHSDPEGAPATGTGDYLVLQKYSYDFAGRQASVTDAMGRRLEYQYYKDDLPYRTILKNFHNPDGTTRDFIVEENEYDGAGNAIKKTLNNGQQSVANEVDAAGKVVKTTSMPGTNVERVSTFKFDLNGNVTLTTQSGKPSNLPWLVAAETQQVAYVYDDGNKMTKETVTGSGGKTQVTTNKYDKRGLLVSSTDPRGNVTGADPAAYTTDVTNDELGRPTVTTDAPAKAESNGQPATTVRSVSKVGFNAFGEQVATQDPLGNISRAEFDLNGRPVKGIAPSYTAPGASEAVIPVTETRYDPAGNAIETIDPDGTSTRFNYDQLNRLTVKDEPGRTNDDRAITRMTYSRTGKPLAVVGPTGARVETTYDDLDRTVTSTQVERYPATDNFTTRITYDDAGNVVATKSPSGATTQNAFDGQGQVIKTTSPQGVVTQFGYDYSGRQVRATDGKGRTTRVGYDLFGNRISDSNLNAAGDTLRTTTYDYDPTGNLVQSTDPYQTKTTYTWDAANQLVSQTEPVTDTKSITTSWGYDAAGNRTRYTDGRGNSTIYTVNSLGLNESTIDPATTAQPATTDRTWSVAYDKSMQAVRLYAPAGVIRTRGYDAAGNMTSETGAGAEAATTARTLGYDTVGRLTSVSAPGGTDTYSYNDRGNLLGASGPSGNASFAFDADGNQTSRTDAAGTAVFAYDRGRLDTVKDGLTGVTEKLGYDSAGMLTSIAYGALSARTYGYDDYGRISSDTIKNSAGQTVSSIAYGFDLNGQVTSKNTTGTAGSGQNTYGYDKAGRLTSWTSAAGTVAYEWDDSGNRVKAGSKTATYDERNRLLSDGDYTYAYTARGTLKSRTSSGLTEQYAFDAFDRMVTGIGTNYTYDGSDRVAARNGIRWTYGGGSDDPVSDGAETFARGLGGELLAVGQGQQARLTIADVHGDIVAVLDPTQTSATKPASSTAYDPWGKVLATDGDTGNLGFQGDWTDPDTKQIDMGARWYDPGTGTFDSRDTVDYSSGDSILANRYAYGAGAPLDYNDPDGHWPNWKKIGSSISSGWNTVKTATVNFASSVASTVYNSAVSFGRTVWSGIKAVGSAIKHTAVAFYHASGLDRVVNKVREGYHALKSGNFKDWAKQQARAAAKHLNEVRKAVTAKARAAVKAAIKYTPIPAIMAAAKPLIKMAGKVIQSAAKIAPALVSMTVQAVTDPSKFATNLYNKAVESVGAVVATVSKAADAVGQFVQEHQDAIIEGLAIIGGIAAGVACGAITLGVGAVACAVGAAALINLGKDAAQGNIHSFGDAFKSAAIGGLQGLVGAGAGAIGGKLAGAVLGKMGGFAGSAGGRALGGAIEGGVSDSITQYATTGKVDLVGVAMSTGIGAATGGFGRSGGGRRSEGGSCRTPNSFDGATGVLMADGSTKRISLVMVGDTVVATDPTTGRTEDRVVTDVIVGTGEKHLVEITVDTDTGLQRIVATDEHPFWVTDLQTWVFPKNLRPGYRFETADHRQATVHSTRAWTENTTVYNLTVDELHTYYVEAGNTPVLVHNCGEDIYDNQGRTKHGREQRQTSRGVSGAEPTDGQAAFENSIEWTPEAPGQAPRRIGVSNGEIVILDRTEQRACGCGAQEDGYNNIWHGHVRPWDELKDNMKEALKKAKLVDKKGRQR
ncbi:LamG-like jellyroll fold domain-containing protein [Actinoplanes sp. NPDC049265]|uniref:LamG-like jellyroll fold domain-containing protein n=1 Tax=Actinoplanes sp. NPDC049265 TaxID=3363902 RepID=UPI0037191DAE